MACLPQTQLDAIELGDPVAVGPFGSPVAVESSLDCPPDTVAAGIRVEGDTYAARFHLRCRTIGVQWP